MKITIVAFDLWGFNKQLVEYLKLQGIEVTFYDSNSIRYIYKSKSERVKNFFSKVFLNQNIKKDYLNKTLIRKINSLELQDYIFIVNPGQFKQEIIGLLRNKASQFIAYNYDSLARIPLPENRSQLFDKIFSFDLKDVRENDDLTLLTNFIYVDREINPAPKNKAFMILSKSVERERILSRIADIFDRKNISNYEFIVANPATKKVNKHIKLTEKHIPLQTVISKMKEAEILIDLVRPNQSGLSFRVFEAMAFHKKLITNNETIKEYDFYDPENILILDNSFKDIPDAFLNQPYKEIPEDIYRKYTLEHFAKTVFPTINIQ